MVINWFPYKIPVVVTKMPQDEFGEFFFFPSPKINVSEFLTGSILSSTILHEVLEMVNEVHDLGLTESQIRTLEVSLVQIMGQNPHLTDTVFPKEPLGCPGSDPGDEDDSEAIRKTGSDPGAS